MRKRARACGAAAVALAALAACAGPRPRPPRGPVVLTVDGRVEGGTYQFGADDLPDLPRRGLRAAPPGRDPGRFEGLDVLRLLADAVSLAPGADLVVFHAADGRVAAAPLPLLQQARPVLVGEGRLALVWPTLDQPGLDTDPRLRGLWLTGVDRLELQRWSSSWGRALRVPPGAGDGARRGAGVVAAGCLGCHALRGVGGTRAPALARLVPEGGRGGWAARLRTHAAQVGGVAIAHPGGAAALADLEDAAAFLEAVRRAGPEEPPPAEGPEDEQRPDLPLLPAVRSPR